ncbi:unnamed protein product [Laminaria digitata]
MRLTQWLVRLTLLLTLSMTTFGCASEFIRGEDVYKDDVDFIIDDEAKIRDTSENRAILDVMAKYRQAMVKKDFGTLNRIIDDGYYDNGSTTNTTRDDYGREQLDELFEMLANHAESIQYRITIKEITIERSEAFVDYEYRYAYQFKVGEEISWDAGVEVNRVTLQRKNEDEWKILSGL